MSKNEMELIGMIREHDSPDKALMVAIGVITDFLMQSRSYGGPVAACPPGPDGTDQ